MSVHEEPPEAFEQPPASLGPAPTTRRSQGIRAGVAVAAVVSLLVGVSVVAGAGGRTAVDPPGPVVDASASASAKAEQDEDGDRGPRVDKFLKQIEKLQGLREKLGVRGFGKITITKIDGNTIGLKTDDGWTRTITVTTDTKILRGTVEAKVGDLKVGDTIALRQQRNADGTFSIVSITVPVPHAAGEVSAVAGNTITIKGRDGVAKTVTLTASTTYHFGRGDGTKADVVVGSQILVEGDVNASDLTATVIWVAVPHVAGEVTAKTASSITVRRRDGTSITIHVASSTTFRVRGKGAAATLADVVVGARIAAEGRLRADGSMDATSVQAGKIKPDKVEEPAASPTG